MFHEYRDLITELKQKDGHFHKLFEAHNALDDSIAKLEKSHADQFEIESKKKEKLKKILNPLLMLPYKFVLNDN